METPSNQATESRLLSFYRHEGPDSEGRSLREIRAWNAARLEGVHDYIQWLFPTRQRSQFNANAPAVGAAEINAFREDEKLRAELVASLRQMLGFYGFAYGENVAGKPLVTQGPDWPVRSAEWFYPGDHNLLRITRILDCLSTFGLTEHARAFLDALEAACEAAPGDGPQPDSGFLARSGPRRPTMNGEWRHLFTHLGPLLSGWAGVGVLVVIAALAVAAFRLGGPDLPYVAAPALLTPAERAFFVVLQRAVADDYHLFAKVRLGDILQVERGIEGKRRYAAFGRISSKHADFVACDPRTFAVVGVIELDDRSHQRADRQRRDEFFDAALKVAGIPILRVPARRNYSPKDLRDQTREAFGRL